MKNSTLILRIPLAIIFFMHSVPGMFNGGVKNFGELFLDPLGFAPFGVLIAWLIKLSHVGAVISFVSNKYIQTAAWVTIFILVVGIFTVHLQSGWFVVGGGSNGVEYNVLLIAVLLFLIFNDRASRDKI